jgi:hypothetical protein
MRAAGRAHLYAAIAGWPPFAQLLAAKDTWDCPEPLLLEQQVAYGKATGAALRSPADGKRE